MIESHKFGGLRIDMSIKRGLIRSLLVCTGLLGLGLFGEQIIQPINSTPTQVQAKARIRKRSTRFVSKRTKQNRYWQRTMTKFAKQRQNYRHPTITWNTRDLGGYLTANGKYKVRNGMIYRSANLHTVNAKGAHTLKRLHIKTDIDLRNKTGANSNIHAKPGPGEFGYMKDPYRLHIRYIQQHVETGKEETETWPKRKKYGEVYRFGYWYTLSPTAKHAYYNSIMDILKYTGKNRAVLFNCTQGRDRTGTLSTILLTALGVPKKMIYKDFLLTNYYQRQSDWVLQRNRLDRFYSTATKRYGSMHNYLHKGLGLSNKTIHRLRSRLLVSIVKPNKKKPRKVIVMPKKKVKANQSSKPDLSGVPAPIAKEYLEATNQ